jgi:hypothetical protein
LPASGRKKTPKGKIPISLPLIKGGWEGFYGEVQIDGFDSFGKRIVKVVPPPSSLSTEIEPRWASTILLTIERPSPVPTI